MARESQGNPVQLLNLPFELKSSIGRYLCPADVKALSTTCRTFRETLIPIVFRHVRIGGPSPEENQPSARNTDQIRFSKVHQDLTDLVDDKAKPILSSIRSFDFCMSRYSSVAPTEDIPLWLRDTNTRNIVVAEILCEILHKCQAKLSELSIDTRWHAAAATPIAERISALKERGGLRFERLRALHIRTFKYESAALELALFPICPNLDTLLVSGNMAESITVDWKLYSSVKYLSVVIEGYHVDDMHTPEAVGAIVVRDAVVRMQCPSLKQLALPHFWGSGPKRKSQARKYFAAMPKLELLQWSKNRRSLDLGHNTMARRTKQAIADSSSSPNDDTEDDDTEDDDTEDDDTEDDDTEDDDTVDDVFEMGRIQSSHALARFQHRPGRGGNDRAEGWDRKYEFSDQLRWAIEEG
ncbi:hypothetical protein CSOJ01_07971 [Colletotrichum sojae]|uniref:F-box domain-containing protein n=1 Tax=Colletotrichum sojae TaxID=2175907 RepID=A0A8H6MSU8_9PEZI|nr:hypothetical protein CSOJ01_07971 [Colletotrichum sojae]